jgi:hypothetical protein
LIKGHDGGKGTIRIAYGQPFGGQRENDLFVGGAGICGHHDE